MAADLTLRGFKVTLFEMPEFAESIQEILKTRRIKLVGGTLQGTAQINKITTDLSDAVNGAKTILIVVPSFAHETYAQALGPLLCDGQVVCLLPGTLGSLQFKNILRRMCCTPDITIVESNTLPYACRIVRPGEVRIYYSPKNIGVGVFPAKRMDSALEDLKELFPLKLETDVLACGLGSLNPILHVPGVLLNAGRIEYSHGEFYLYEEGITPSVAKVTEDLDDERLSISRKLGYDLASLKDALCDAGYGPKGNLWQTVKGSYLTPIKGPSNLRSRYLTEDVPFGLVPWSNLGNLAEVETPFMDAFILLASKISGEDYYASGRTLDKMGIVNMSVETLKRYVHNGLQS